MSDDEDLEAVLELLTDEDVRTILKATSTDSLSAGELAERCNASQQTIYRRLERLQAVGLVEDHARVRKDGHHDTVYSATLETVSISLRDGSIHFSVDRTRSDPADQLTDLWRNF